MKRNKFNLSHTKLFSCDMGELVPCGLYEVLPGDTIQQSTSLLVRASPLLAPVMHPCDVRIHHFFVPYRLIWTSWADFITQGPNGTSFPTVPYVAITNPNFFTVGSLGDYLGLPTITTAVGSTINVSMLPFRAYALVYNEYYRDADLMTPVPVSVTDGIDAVTNLTLQRIAWEKDYFTSARPWEQKGAVISVPITGLNGLGQLPISGLGIAGSASAATNIGSTFGFTSAQDTASQPGWSSGGTIVVRAQSAAVPSNANRPQVYVDTSVAGITVNNLRQSLALQRFQEARARYGSRYTEYLRYLGVRSSDARLQRPEYLGGGRQVLQWSEVVQTGSDGSNPIGTLRGHGISAMRSNRYRRFFEEHGLVMSFFSVRPKTIYMNGSRRLWLKTSQGDYWQKEFEHIGQQAVTAKELYWGQGGAGPNANIGYQDRYDEYRRIESGVSGEFRTTLNHWHLARDITSDVALNAPFVTCTPTERVFAAPSADNLYVYAQHHIVARRLVAKVGTSRTF